MLLQYYQTEFSIPHTSKCHLKTSGLVNNGGQVTITSPVFSSIDYNSKALTLSSEFTVPIRLMKMLYWFVMIMTYLECT